MFTLPIRIQKMGGGSPIALTVESCVASSQFQTFAYAALPANMHSQPANSTQIVSTGTGIPTCPSSGESRCCVNVDAWGTHAGDTVWTTLCAPQEVVTKENNRVWVHRADGSLFNPAAHLCVDANGGTAAKPGAKLELSDCDGADASKWVHSATNGGTFQQSTHSGAYPGLCITLKPTAPAPTPTPPPMPAQATASLSVDVSAGASNSTTSDSLVSFNFDWHANTEEVPLWINMSAMILDLDDPMLRAGTLTGNPYLEFHTFD